MSIRIAVLSYPMLFQTTGGLSMKVARTVGALNAIGCEAQLVDPVRERLGDFDIVHVFAPYNGNHRIVEQAKADGVPVVISTILNPPFSRWDRLRAEVLSRLVGRLTGWTMVTDYQQISRALRLADHLIALGRVEKAMLMDGYGAEAGRVSIVHNGVSKEFFSATGHRFREQYSIARPFILHTGIIGDVKNQLGLVRALKGHPIDILMIGYCSRANRPYLEACLRDGGSRVRYLGEIPHGELLASAYAAAELIAVPSFHEGMPNSILEGLASDKPVVMTNNHTVDLELPVDVVAQVDARDQTMIRDSVLHFLEDKPAPGRARSLVSSLTWEAVASQLDRIYRGVLSQEHRQVAFAD